MIMLECAPPFQWKPKLYRSEGFFWRFIWFWFAVSYTPGDFNEFIEAIAKTATELHKKGELFNDDEQDV